ncbi:hypothetical protein L6R53_09640 [Myxococcota bacterium]|nr:hypothetical protein [Myxococcota bacterium]
MARPSPPPAPVVLTVGAGRGVVLGLPGAAPATGELAEEAIAAVAARVEGLVRAPAGLLLSASDLDAAARERQAGEVLAALFDPPALREVRDALVAWAARGQPLHLVVDARTPAARALPWELLLAIPPGRSPLAATRVLRLQAAPPPVAPPPSEGLELRLWVADPADPVSARVAAALEATVAGLVGLRLRRLPSDLSGPPAPAGGVDRGGPAVLHLLTHGAGALDRVGLAGPGGPRAADTVARALQPWSAGALLAVTDVCGGAAATTDPADAPTWRLAMGGPPVVVGPRTRWAAEASVAFSAALYGALARGEAVGEAVEAGRLALRGLAIPHESGRWWTPLAIVSTPLAAGLRLARPPLSLPGWPASAPDAAAWLRAAADRARGYLGVEHLLAACTDPALSLPPRLAALRPALAELAARVPPAPHAGPAEPTPRLRGLGAELAPGFDAVDLARQLACVPWLAALLDPAVRARLLAPPEDDGRGTLPLEPVEAPPLSAEGLVLEVEAGPEDGRLLALRAPGEVLGRWDPGQPDVRDLRLYVDRADADRTLSRQHLSLEGPGLLRLRGATRLQRGPGPAQPAQGVVAVQAGDLLVLGAGTRLRVR